MRNERYRKNAISVRERHNERKNEVYSNPDVLLAYSRNNVTFKTCEAATYAQQFDRMVEEGVVSTRGLKPDAYVFDELVFDVNTDYFETHGGYEYAKQFYAEVYELAKEIAGGEQYIISAVMHADERKQAISVALGKDVFHYHLHVVYVPIVEKQILWSKRCKDKSLVGTVKETIMQVSSSKKWLSKPALDEQGAPILQKNGKPVLRKSYSVLQDDFFRAMRNAGYTDVERGERGRSEEHLSVTQFKVMKEQERLTELTAQTAQKSQEAAALDQKIERVQKQQLAVERVEKIEPKSVPLSSKVMLDRSEYESLATAAKKYVIQEKKERHLQKLLDAANQMISKLERKIAELMSELAKYKSVRGKLHINELEQENAKLRDKLRSYETVIDRHDLWHLFGRKQTKTATREESR